MKNDNTDINSVLKTDGGGKWKRRLILLALLAILAGGALFIMGGRQKAANTPSYATAEITRGDIVVTVSATGTLEPTNEVEVGSEISGTIESVYADFNSHVKKGQLLVRLDTTKLEAQVTQAKASLEAAKANVLQMKATEKEALLKLNQIKKLYEVTEGRSPSRTEVDAAEAAYERALANTASARASVTQAEATLEGYETDMSKAEIHSPVDGMVLDKSIEEGQTVAASLEAPVLFTIAEDLKQMELHVYVDEADIGQVTQGQKASFTVDAYPDRTFEGTIIQARYGSETVDNVVTYETIIKVDNSDMFLRPGMTATADITVREINNVLMVPNAALRYAPAAPSKEESFISKLMPRPPRRERAQPKAVEKGKITVWALEEGREMPYNVRLGDSDGSRRQILDSELREGMKLITGKSTNGN